MRTETPKQPACPSIPSTRFIALMIPIIHKKVITYVSGPIYQKKPIGPKLIFLNVYPPYKTIIAAQD